jgi:cytolysin (calcineurin-like family phosphatase)
MNRPTFSRIVARRLLSAAVWLLLWTGALPMPARSAAPTAPARPAGESATAELTFFVVSDTHYGQSPRGDETIPLLVEKMNQLPGTAYPDKIGGKVGVPKGVLHVGDVTNDGKERSWKMFVRDYGLTGKEGKLKYPVYETFGNHDGGPKSVVRTAIQERNRGRVGLTALSDNGLFCSWDWGGIHFVCLGVSPGTTIRPYDPEYSIDFAKADLAKRVGRSGRPVILLHHFGFDRGHSLRWWSEEWRTAYYDVIKDYNVAGIIHGHAHEPLIYQWNGLDIYHPPHFRQKDPKQNDPVTHGFFVFRVRGDTLTVVERKLDDTWGMTARKVLKPAAAAAE